MEVMLRLLVDIRVLVVQALEAEMQHLQITLAEAEDQGISLVKSNY